MKRVTILALVTSLFISAIAVANEVNVFNARHYKADAELYSKFKIGRAHVRTPVTSQSRMPSSA